MAKLEEIDDLDAQIDRAVDTFFVEEPSEDELNFFGDNSSAPPPEPVQPPPSGPSLDEAMDSLFSTSFQEAMIERTPTVVTSGDVETDRAIDLAVDTLFVEEPEAEPPETQQLEVTAIEVPLGADQFRKDHQEQEPPPQRLEAPPPVKKPPVVKEAEQPGHADYDDVMAQEIERHMRTVYQETTPEPPAKPAPVAPARAVPQKPPQAAPRPAPQAAPRAEARTAAPKPTPPSAKQPTPRPPAAPVAKRPPVVAPPQRRAEPKPPEPKPAPTTVAVSPMRKLQEAILTLEWEISKRSIAVLTVELKKVRIRYQDDMTVDFAVVAMKLVLEYLAQRMSRAHPESIRFLLEVTDLLERSVGQTNRDPLGVFHRILNRYETFKSIVRKAEGLPDRRPPLMSDLEIRDPQAFAKLVEAQALTLIKAGRSLARGLEKSKDPENLIRSFRFLVNRSINRILESTRKEKEGVEKDPGRKNKHTNSVLR